MVDHHKPIEHHDVKCPTASLSIKACRLLHICANTHTHTELKTAQFEFCLFILLCIAYLHSQCQDKQSVQQMYSFLNALKVHNKKLPLTYFDLHQNNREKLERSYTKAKDCGVK